MKAAAANRKATQEAHDKILAAKKVFVPEENPAFQQKPSDGKDIWADMFTKYEEPPKSELPGSSVRLPQVCLEKMKVIGFEASQVVGELWGWQHKTLGWRVNLICTHDGSAGKAFWWHSGSGSWKLDPPWVYPLWNGWPRVDRGWQNEAAVNGSRTTCDRSCGHLSCPSTCLALGHQHQLYEYSTCNVIQGFTIWDVRPRFPASNILCGACPTVSGQQPSVFKREIIGVCFRQVENRYSKKLGFSRFPGYSM